LQNISTDEGTLIDVKPLVVNADGVCKEDEKGGLIEKVRG
jgi:hypothetical protein